MISLLGRAALAVGPCSSWLRIFLANPLLPAKFLLRNQLTVLWELPCRQITAFKILSLSLTFGIIIMMCLGMGLFASILFGTLFASCTCVSISFTKWGKFSFIIFSDRFPISCSFSSSSGSPLMWMLDLLKLSQRLLTLSSFFWILYFSCCSDWLFFFASLCSKSLIWFRHFSASDTLLCFPVILYFD